eukprot:1190176-Prorocentrum_minimum.AAC.3
MDFRDPLIILTTVPRRNALLPPDQPVQPVQQVALPRGLIRICCTHLSFIYGRRCYILMDGGVTY